MAEPGSRPRAERVQKLHLVGFTTDHEGLILSARRGARSGGYVLTVDDALEEALDDLRAERADDADDAETAARAPRVESNLPVREIQARLRQGRSIAEVAKAAGVEPEWVDRFAPPILAERARVIRKVRAAPLRRARLGPSAQPIGDAVRHHLGDRGVAMTADEFDEAWTARQLIDGRWAVRFSFHYRGRNQVLQFDLEEASGGVAAADRLSGQLGYVAPPASSVGSGSRAASPSGAKARPTVKRAVVTTGFRPDRGNAKAVSRSAKEREKATVAMRKAAAQRAVEAERAAARRARERAAAARRKEREDKARAVQVERDRRQREAAKAAQAKEAAAKKAAAASAKTAKAKVAASAKAAATKAALKKAVAKKAVAKKAATTRRAAGAKKRAVKKAPVRKAPVKKAASARKHPVKKSPVTKQAVKKAVTKAVKKAPAAPAPRPASVVARPALPPRPVSEVAAAVGGPFPRALARPTPPPVRVAPAAATPRPLFRPGLVEHADDERLIQDRLAARRALADGAVQPAVQPVVRPTVLPSPNGAGDGPPARPQPDRPRRTRPLRAT